MRVCLLVRFPDALEPHQSGQSTIAAVTQKARVCGSGQDRLRGRGSGFPDQFGGFLSPTARSAAAADLVGRGQSATKSRYWQIAPTSWILP
jgi:hypothetical protein